MHGFVRSDPLEQSRLIGGQARERERVMLR
jgi:hypothetical protein